MFALKHKIEGAFFIAIAAGVGLFLAVMVNRPQWNVAPTMLAIDANSIPTPIPTEIFVPKESTASEISSDGTRKVILRTIENKNKTQNVTLATKDEEDSEQIVFNIMLEEGKSITIPYNSWSPDNKYFFIQLNKPQGKDIMVFRAKGEPFATGESYLDLTGLFAKKETGNNFKEATGWGSESLIILNTTTSDAKQGPSYWFEVPSKAIIQLSTLFD